MFLNSLFFISSIMKMIYWKCPNCGREFIKQNQFHPCVSISIDEHFKKKPPILKDTFNSLREKIKEFGQIRIDAVKTAINIGGKSHFSTVYVLKESIKLDFVLDRRINSPRIIRVRGPTNNYFTYTIKIKKFPDVDDELISWLRASYNLRNK